MPTTLTVVTPSYNQARYLGETLRSVISQRDRVHEYFVLDGGSTDGSRQLIERYADHIDFWVSDKDKGQSDAIHRGFARATGDVLCWLNSDDVFLPGVLRTVLDAFDRHPEWDVLTAYHLQHDADGRVLKAFRIPRDGDDVARWGVVHVCQQTCFFRRRVYEEHQIACHAVVLGQVGTVRKTTSGKVRRLACRQAYLSGEVAQARTTIRVAIAQPSTDILVPEAR